MSFMFNPHPYDDPSAINQLTIPGGVADDIFTGTERAAGAMMDMVKDRLAKAQGVVLTLDGYPGAQFQSLVDALLAKAGQAGISAAAEDASRMVKSAKELDALFEECFPDDKEKDPILLYGKLFDGNYPQILDPARCAEFCERAKNSKGLTILYGFGAASEPFDSVRGLVAWVDVTPKRAVLSAKKGLLKNIGDTKARPFKQTMRRAYYVDFKVAEELRGKLLRAGSIDAYLSGNDPDAPTMLTRKGLDDMLGALAKQPYRCRPVYIEGVWGGQYIKKLRRLPDEVDNVAWCFDLIPLEVSIVAEAEGCQVEFPYHTFVQKEGDAIMGAPTTERFGGYFPIRFNYDDTWHASGNMSIQVHPGEDYVVNNFKDLGRQDESYYIVSTAHGAKTYCGFHDNADTDEFMRQVKRSEIEKTPVNHDDYVFALQSVPGMQFMLPAGTIHASGRNQVILEIGSLTVGSYTFKLYDYLRLDLDGAPRPIHSWHGEKVLDTACRTKRVTETLAPQPRTVRKTEGLHEEIVGECDELYFSLRRLSFDKMADGDTNGVFHVLVLVDGEKVTVRSKSNPSLCYDMNYLDMVVVPASVGEYEIINHGKQPVVVHKTHLKG